MALTLGIAIHRRTACVVALEITGRERKILWERTLDRSPGTPASEALSTLITEVPIEYRKARLQVSLSSSDLACADSWTPSAAHRSGAIEKILPTLAESRCAGETLETLALDVLDDGTEVHAIAFRRPACDGIREALSDFECTLVTSIPHVVSGSSERIAFTYGGDRFEWSTDAGERRWRAFPKDGVDDSEPLQWNGHELSPSQIAAFATATADPERSPNLMNSTSKASPAWLKKCLVPLINVAAALILCLIAGGVHFHREMVREKTGLAAIHGAEKELWRLYLPAETPREGAFLRAAKDRVAEFGDAAATSAPSALAFWEEIGRQFPDVEALQLTLESIDLGPDGGRLSARVPAAKEDPLKNASLLESQLNRPPVLSARGDYEVKDAEVHVRLRMDYRP